MTRDFIAIKIVMSYQWCMRVVIIGGGGAELVMQVFSVHGSYDNTMSLYTGRSRPCTLCFEHIPSLYLLITIGVLNCFTTLNPWYALAILCYTSLITVRIPLDVWFFFNDHN